MTPDQFSHQSGAWLAAIAGLFAPLTALVGGIFGFLAFIKAKTNELRLNGHSRAIQTLQVNTPPPGSQNGGAAVNVNAAPPSDITINETKPSMGGTPQ